MFRDKKKPGSVNRWGLHAATAAFWSYATLPEPDASFQNWAFPAALAALAAAGTIRVGHGFWEDLAIRRIMMNAANPSGKFGNADFASLEEREAAGLHDGSGYAFAGTADDIPCFPGPTPGLLVEAASGGGKTSALGVNSIWHSVFSGRSCITADSKPEYVWMMAEVLRGLGFRVKINNPAGVGGMPHDDFNLFQIVVDVANDPARSHETFPIADTLTKVIVPDVDDGKNRFFTQIDQQVLTFVQVALAVLHPSLCYPAQIHKHVADPMLFEDLLFEAKDSDALAGDLATLARALLKKDRENPEHLEGARTGAGNGLSWAKPSSSLGHYGSNHSYDIEDARDPTKPPMVVFDVFPADQLNVYAMPNELTNTARMQVLKRHPEGREVVIVADEFTALPIRAIATEIEFIRSFNIRLIAAYQSWSSLKRVYGEARAESLRANCAQLYFSVNDLKSAKEISDRVGEYTIKTESHSFDEGQKPKKSVGETGRKRLPPEELLSLGRNQAILMVPGMRPVKLRTVPWYEIAPIKDQLDENPHERHPKSPVTQLTMIYGKDASELGPPVVPDIEQRLERARKADGLKKTPGRVPLVRPYKLLWVPLVAAFLAFALTTGTPHLGWMSTPYGDGWVCGYLGIGGFEMVKSTHGCPGIGWLPPHAEKLP